MIINCPNCSAVCEQNSAPVRGPVSDGSEIWVCLKCPAQVCTSCWHNHTIAAHPEWLKAKKQPTGGGKKNLKHKK